MEYFAGIKKDEEELYEWYKDHQEQRQDAQLYNLFCVR